MSQNKIILATLATCLLATSVVHASTSTTTTTTTDSSLNQYNRAGVFGLTLEASQLIFDSSRNLSDKIIPQAGLTYDIDSHFAIQAMFSLLNTNQINTGLSVHGSYYSLNGLLFLENTNPFQPYLTAGIGALKLDPNGVVNSEHPDGDLPKMNANLNIGAGFQLFLTHHVAVQIEGKELYTPAQSDNDFLVNGGLTFLFGSHPTALSSTETNTQDCELNQNVTIEFEKNSTHMTNVGREKVNNIAACLSANPKYYLHLTNLISNQQESNSTVDLLLARSKVIIKTFVSLGISTKRIITQQIVGKSGTGRSVIVIYTHHI